MYKLNKLLFICLLFGVLSCACAWGDSGGKKIKLKDVNVLTLTEGRMTTGRRSSPVPQLVCTGGRAGCGSHRPQTVQCTNKGSNGIDYQWECKADMSDSYKFGKIDVSCEGYEYPDDPYVLAGSCGLRYTLELTSAGEKRQQHNNNWKPSYNSYSAQDDSSFAPIIFFIGIVMCVLLCKAITSNNIDSPNDDNRGEHFSGGPNNTGFTNPQPPPYGFKPEYTQQPPSYAQSTQGTRPTGNTGTGNSGPGFWSGVGMGALGGYLFGGQRTRTPGYSGYGYHSNSWGSTTRTHSRGSSPERSRTTYGFGGTSRR